MCEIKPGGFTGQSGTQLQEKIYLYYQHARVYIQHKNPGNTCKYNQKSTKILQSVEKKYSA